MASEVNMPWIGGRYAMSKAVDIPCVGESIYHG